MDGVKYIDPATTEGYQLLIDSEVPEEEIKDVIKAGEQYRILGQHDLLSSPGKQGWSKIQIFRSATEEEVFHEFTHALQEQGGIPGWMGTPEEIVKFELAFYMTLQHLT